MIEAVFISDLHLCTNTPEITKKFYEFLAWAEKNVASLYILGDFFNLWAGDDIEDAFSHDISLRLAMLRDHGMKTYFMHGNRDFLIAETFLKKAKLEFLEDPSLIQLSNMRILLTHGDRYCIFDRQHQRFRAVTRTRYFKWCFLSLPRTFRLKMAQKIRQKSMSRTDLSMQAMDVNQETILDEMRQFQVNHLIHGHTHRPSMHHYSIEGQDFYHYVLSDWDDIPIFLCYSSSEGLFYKQFLIEVGEL